MNAKNEAIRMFFAITALILTAMLTSTAEDKVPAAVPTRAPLAEKVKSPAKPERPLIAKGAKGVKLAGRSR